MYLKKVQRINESQLNRIVAECVKKVLNETELDYDEDNFSGRYGRGTRYNIYIGDSIYYRDIPEDALYQLERDASRKAKEWGEEVTVEEI